MGMEKIDIASLQRAIWPPDGHLEENIDEVHADDARRRRRVVRDRKLAGAGHCGTHPLHAGFAGKLAAAGELLGAEGLGGPDEAKLVRAGAAGEPITDGVFPESKEFLAGFWLWMSTHPSAPMRSLRRLLPRLGLAARR